MLLAGFALHTGTARGAGQVSPYDSEHGSVWLRVDGSESYREALQLETDVGFQVSGLIARATVRQQFRNDSDTWAEGLYVFPLPDDAAVDHFRLRIGERVIEGQVMERAAAKKTYEQAKQAGKRTGLVEQQRPNVFTTSLANIAPGETLVVEIEYQQTLVYREGVYRLRFPMVVGPRYRSPPTKRPEGAGVPEAGGCRSPGGRRTRSADQHGTPGHRCQSGQHPHRSGCRHGACRYHQRLSCH
jgi:Ca-activated chloride channel family protein